MSSQLRSLLRGVNDTREHAALQFYIMLITCKGKSYGSKLIFCNIIAGRIACVV
jgi:hypothetical protein